MTARRWDDSDTYGLSEQSKLSPEQTRKHCCGNICDSRCFLKCFPACPPVETLLRKQNLLLGKQKCFQSNSGTFHVSQAWFLLRKHLWLAMFPQSFPVCPPAETLLWKQNLLPGKLKCFLSNSETLHVSQAWFLLRKHCFLMFAHLGKHGETLAGNNVSAAMFPSLPKALEIAIALENPLTSVWFQSTILATR